MSKNRPKSSKPAKPYPDFPLFAHDSGRWAKKIRGKLVYFGRWGSKAGDRVEPVDDVAKSADEAVELYRNQAHDLHAGRRPREVSTGVTVADACNAFLHAKRLKMDAGELSPRTWADYEATSRRMTAELGRAVLLADLRPDDFTRFRSTMAKTLGPRSLGNEINRVRIILRWAQKAMGKEIGGMVDVGPDFTRPSQLAVRKDRQAKGKRMFQPAELRALLKYADPQLKAMILLGVNCGLGNNDCARLPVSAIDLKAGTLDYPRPKTAIHRRAFLWPETVEALKAVLATRPTPRDPEDAGLVFLTRFGTRWVREELRPAADGRLNLHLVNSVSRMFARLLEDAGIRKPGERVGLNFYALRHTFETVARQARDREALDYIMGHADTTIGGHYNEEAPADARLRAVTDHVRGWAFPRRQKPAGDVVGKIGPDGEGRPARRARRVHA